MKFVEGTPAFVADLRIAQVTDLWAFSDVSVPRIEGLPIGAFIVHYGQRSDGTPERSVAFPTDKIGCAHWPSISRIEPLYAIKEAASE